MRSLALAALMSVSVGCLYDFDKFAPGGGAGDSGVTDTGSPADGGGCSEPGAKSSGGVCYFPTSSALSWNDAKAACAAAGGHLATVSSSAEETVVESVGTGDRWIGLSRPSASPPKADSFTWITGEPMSYLKWGSGQPSGAGECGMMRGAAGWGDAACTTALVGVCER